MVETLTLAEQFAPFLAGRYTGQPASLWRLIERTWNGVSDWDMDVLLFDTARETRVEGKGHDVERWCLWDAISGAIERCDHIALMVAADQAEEVGVLAEVCELTRAALRVQYH